MSMGNEQIQIQIVVLKNSKESVLRQLQSVDNAVRVFRKQNKNLKCCINIMDVSCERVLSKDDINMINSELLSSTILFYNYKQQEYSWGEAHNIIGKDVISGYIMFLAEEVLLEPSCILRMYERMSKSNVVAVEARQTPMEFGKEYSKTGITDWICCKCTMIKASVFHEMCGFDTKYFLHYFLDVDLSWRIRLAGYELAYEPSAVFFLRGLLDSQHAYVNCEENRFAYKYDIMVLQYKWSELQKVSEQLKDYSASDDKDEQAVFKMFTIKKEENELPQHFDESHNIARFYDDSFTMMRY